MTMFAARTGVEQVELGHDLAPRFDAEGRRRGSCLSIL